jgi:hypothetical protein
MNKAYSIIGFGSQIWPLRMRSKEIKYLILSRLWRGEERRKTVAIMEAQSG